MEVLLVVVGLAISMALLLSLLFGTIVFLAHALNESFETATQQTWNTIWRGHTVEVRRFQGGRDLRIDGRKVSTTGGWMHGTLDLDGREVEVRALLREGEGKASGHIFIDGVLVGGEQVPSDVVLPPELSVAPSDRMAKLLPLLSRVHERADDPAVRDAAATLERALRERARLLEELDGQQDDRLEATRQESEIVFERLTTELRTLYVALLERKSAAPEPSVSDALMRIQAEKELDDDAAGRANQAAAWFATRGQPS